MKSRLLLLLFILSFFNFSAQLAGVYSVPGTFTSIAKAIGDLTTFGVSGPVTVNIAAGYTETAPPGGYVIYNIIGSSTLNTITFQKSGAGANPLINAYSGGTAGAWNTVQDGVIKLVGADNIILDGLSIVDNNSSSYSYMEYGIALFKANGNDGCQNNTIKNCVITLSRANGITGTEPGLNGSRCIELIYAQPSNHLVSVAVTSPQGRHYNNKIQSNVLQQCAIGVSMVGYKNYGTNLMLADSGNVIGGLTAAAGNTIVNFGVGSVSSGIFLKSQYNTSILNNLIDSNNGNGAPNSYADINGIYNEGTINNITISNNTLSVKATTYCPNGYLINNLTGSVTSIATIDITNNLFSGSSSTLNPQYIFKGIYNAVSCQSLTIANNSFTNNLIYTNSNASYIIQSEAACNYATISNNQFDMAIAPTFTGSLAMLSFSSSAFTNSLQLNGNTFYGGGFSGNGTLKYLCVYGKNAGLSIANNTWTAINSGVSGSLTLIENNCFTTNSVVIVNNSAQAGINLSSGNCNFTGYKGINTAVSPCILTFTGNVLSNVNSTSPGTGSFNGFLVNDGELAYPQKIISNNLVSGITYSSAAHVMLSIKGMGSGVLGSVISSNTITNIQTAGSSTLVNVITDGKANQTHTINANIITQISAASATAGITGMNLMTNGPQLEVTGNLVSGLTSNGSAQLNGMNAVGSGQFHISNNILHNLNAVTSTANPALNGLNLSGIGNYRIDYNTVYLSGSALTSNGIALTSFSTAVLRNNLVQNKITPASTGTTSALFISTSSGSLYANNNVYYAGIPSLTTSVIRTAAGSSYSTIALAVAGLGGQEQNSASENVSFVSLTAGTTGFMSVNAASATVVESGGVPIAETLQDYYGTSRNPAKPDIGAVEGNYIAVAGDSQAPVISGGAFINSSCNLTTRTYTTQLADASGLATGSLSPRLYYKVNNGSYTSVAGSLSSGTNSLGVWSFVLTYTAVPYDTLYYFLSAQDNFSLSNLCTFPSAYNPGMSVNSITNSPNPLKFGLSYALSGTYSVGVSGTFTSLTMAAKAYNTACLNGPVTFVLTNTLYQSAESFPVTFTLNPMASSINSLLIKPAIGINASIMGNISDASVLKFKGARYITVDGNSSSGSLSAVNTNTDFITPAAVIWLCSDAQEESGNNHITFKNLTIGSTVQNYTLQGIHAGDLGGIFSSGIAYNNDFITISNNTITGVGTAIYAASAANINYYDNDNWVINNNQIGPVNSSTANISFGIKLLRSIGFSITGNTLTNVNYAPTSGTFPIGIQVIYCDNMGPSFISKNTIRSMNANGCSGIYLTYSSDIEVSNNMISDIGISGFPGTTAYAFGARMYGASNIRFLNNTIALTQGTLMQSSSYGYVAAALDLTSTSNLDVRNNIFYNNISNNLNSNSRTYGIYCNTSGNTFSYMDYNNYYLPVSNPVLGYNNPNNCTSLAALMFYFGQNTKSTSLPVVFTSSTNPHLDPASLLNWSLQDSGTPLPYINSDIDNQSRNAITPDVGADEWTSTATCTTAAAGTIALSTQSICSTNTATFNVNGSSGGIGNYQWSVSNSTSGPFSGVNAGSGSNTPVYVTGTLTPGTYYYRFEVTCPTQSLTNSSNVATLVVVAPPTVAVTSNTTFICSGGNVSLTATGANSYTWNTGATTASLVTSPYGITNYYVNYSNGVCPANTSSYVTVTYAQTPTLSASNVSVCTGGSGTLNVSGASNFVWSTGATNNSISVNPTVTTVYTVTGISGACTSSRTVSFIVNSYPSLAISGPTTSCAGSTVSLVASGATTFTWSTGLISKTLVTSPSITTVYTVSGNQNGCVSNLLYTLSAAPAPTITISGQNTICAGQSVIINATGANTYSWNTGSVSQSISVNPSTTATYSVTGTSNGCQATSAFQLSVSPNPVISVNSGSICQGQNFTLQPTGAVSYTYSSGSAVVSPTGNTTYSVSGTNSVGCASLLPGICNLTVNSIPFISVNSGTVCSGSLFTITPSGGGTYSIQGGTATVTPLSNSSYTVTGTSVAGCLASNTAICNVTVVPLPTISVNSGNICSGQTFTLIPQGGISYSYSSFSPMVNPAVNTTYTVTGFAANGCYNVAVSQVSVFSLPAISLNGLSVCIGQTSTLTPTGAVSYTFVPAGPVITPMSSQVYTVSGSGTNNCVATVTANVQVNPVPTISVNSGSLCSGNTFTLIPTGASTYTYSSGGPLVSPSVSSVYTVSGTSAAGCSAANVATASVNVYVSPTVSVNNGSICSGQVFIITPLGASSYSIQGGVTTVTPQGNSSYTVVGSSTAGCVSVNTATCNVVVHVTPTLSVNSGSICAGQSFVILPNGANSYSVQGGSYTVAPGANSTFTVAGSSTAGCMAQNIATCNISVNPVPTISAVGGTICSGQVFTITPSGALNYTVQGGSFIVSPLSTTVYTINGSGTGACVSQNAASVVITVNQSPTVTVNSGSICAGNSFTLIPGGASMYTISGGNSIVSPLITSSYSVIGTSSAGCVSPVPAIANVTVSSLPVISVNSGSICEGEPYVISPTGAAN